MGQRTWLIELLNNNYLPAIALLEDNTTGHLAAAELASQIRSVWAKRGLTKLNQQQSLMDITRRAIKDRFGESHFSLNFIKFSTAEYVQLNNHKQDQVALRNESIQYLSDPEAIVAQAVALLDSPDWSQVAAGLTVVTGRRSSEILSTAEFSVASGWSVMFTGALKRRGESQILQFEIPTLAPAELVCTALTSLRAALPEAQQMSAAQVNAQFGAAVAQQCDRFFCSLVPLRAGKDNLYTHLFRAVYATIATFWFCPPQVNATEFKAHIQGHFAVLEETDTDARRSLAASRHYSDYEIADAVIAAHNGQRQGVKLAQPGVEVIQVFRSATSTPPLQGTLGRKHRSSIRVWQTDKPLLNTVLARLGIDDTLNQPERFHLLLQWVVEHLDAAPPLLLESATATTDALAVEAPLTTNSKVEKLSSDSKPQAVCADASKLNADESLSQARSEPVTSANVAASTPITDESLATETSLSNSSVAGASISSSTPTEAMMLMMAQLLDKMGKLTDVMINNHQLQPTSGNPGINSPLHFSWTKRDNPLPNLLVRREDSGHLGAQVENNFNKKQINPPPNARVVPFCLGSPQPASAATAAPIAHLPTDYSTNSVEVSTSVSTEPPRTRRHRSSELELINRVIDAIIAHNNTPGLADDFKWEITINALKSFSKNQRLIERILGKGKHNPQVERIVGNREAEVTSHHLLHHIQPGHNHRHKRKRSITDVVPL